MNPGLPAEVYRNGWIAPFIQGESPTETEITDVTLDIYERTGRIVVDAVNFDNVVKEENDNVICIDIGAALKLESFVDEDKSQATRDFWIEMKRQYNKYYDERKIICPALTKKLKALLVLQDKRPDIRNVAILKQDMHIVETLALVYDGKNIFFRDQLKEILPIKLDFVRRIFF